MCIIRRKGSDDGRGTEKDRTLSKINYEKERKLVGT